MGKSTVEGSVLTQPPLRGAVVECESIAKLFRLISQALALACELDTSYQEQDKKHDHNGTD